MLRVLHRLPRKLALPSPHHNIRCASTTFEYLDIEDTGNEYSIVRMHRKPVNSFNLDFIKEMIEAVDCCEKTSRGMVLTSSLKVFSAGLDIQELYNPSEDRLQEFWNGFQELNLRLHSSPLVTVAAINGPAPAGGCALSLQCDYRIMAEGKSIIGLNETHLGLTAPLWLCKVFAQVVGHRLAELHLSLGTLLPPEEALSIGLIDAVVPADQLMDSADAEMKKWLAIPELGRSRTKGLLRKEYIDEFVSKREEDAQMFTGAVKDPMLQDVLTKYLKALQKRSK